jgi:23S rRNA (cytidine1920-2'-O)/16S rRNA (cytidine1409-2'-O)-methyltransferase
VKKRIDLLLVERGLAESRHKAQALLLAGQILAGEQKVEKPGQLIDPEADIRVLRQLPFASRAGAKLQAALDHFKISIAGRTCADLGASTGGFTDCLIQNGASLVYAFDVGKGQLAWKLQSDPRVVIRDQFNVRNLGPEDLPEVSLVTIDLSFISIAKILPALKESLAADRTPFREGSGRRDAGAPGPKEECRDLAVDVIVLVKPQFEVGKGEVGKGGIVRDQAKRLQALEAVQEVARKAGFRVLGSILSPVAGARGNREFLLYLQL